MTSLHPDFAGMYAEAGQICLPEGCRCAVCRHWQEHYALIYRRQECAERIAPCLAAEIEEAAPFADGSMRGVPVLMMPEDGYCLAFRWQEGVEESPAENALHMAGGAYCVNGWAFDAEGYWGDIESILL